MMSNEYIRVDDRVRRAASFVDIRHHLSVFAAGSRFEPGSAEYN